MKGLKSSMAMRLGSPHWDPHVRGAILGLTRGTTRGHLARAALESVAFTAQCANEGYDGVVHVCPTGCMPEISIRPILRKISQDRNIPLLECSFDEHTSHVGVVTRLEAFVDILADRRKNKRAR